MHRYETYSGDTRHANDTINTIGVSSTHKPYSHLKLVAVNKMKSRIFGSKILGVGLAVTVWLLCSGCAGEPYVYVEQNELKSGPGLFSGEDGEVPLIHSAREIKPESDKDETEIEQ